MTRRAPGSWLRRLVALALGASLVGCLVGCGGSCGNGTDADAGRAAPPPALPAPPQRFWLQDVQLEPLTPGAAAPPEVHLPVHVEMQPDGVVRSLPGETPSFEGRLPAALLKEPADRRGLMLYAQRLVELHHGKPDGLVIGRLYPGAFASVAPAGDASWLVAVPRHGDGEALLTYAAKDALGDTKLPDPPETIPGDTHFDFGFGVPFGSLPPHDQPQGWIQLLCGGVHVDSRVRQYYRGVEIEVERDRMAGRSVVFGLAPERGPTPCLPRYVYRGPHGMFVHSGRDVLDRTDVDTIPPGYLAVVKPEKDPIRAAVDSRSAVYWLSGTSGKLECEEWRFLPRAQRDGSVVHGLVRRGARVDAWYRVDLPKLPKEAQFGSSLSLWGPISDDSTIVCTEPFAVLRVDADRMYMRYFPQAQSWPEREVVAFPPDEVEQWFLTRAACDAVRRVAPQTRDSLAPGLRRPCYRNVWRGNTGYW